MKKRSSVFTLLAIALIAALPSLTAACVCVDTLEGYPACQAFWDNTIIFSGRVVDILPHPKNRENSQATFESTSVQLAIEKPYKGIETRDIEINLEPGTDCTYPFEIGKEYFVYATRNRADNKIYQNSCSRTIPLSQADADVAYAQLVATSKEPQLSLYGSVLRQVDFKTYGQNFIGVKDIKILIESDLQTIEVLTDNQGSFQLFGLKDGLYKVSAQFPKDQNLTYDELPKQVKISSPRCSGAVFVTK